MTANQQTNSEAQLARTAQEPTVQFLLEEYRNIAQTHDRLRDVGMRLMYFILILSAFPFTLAGFVFRDTEFDFFVAPLSLHLLFLIVGLSVFVLAFALLDARLGQYRYARTVNEIRKYFAKKDPGLEDFLYLPVSRKIPDMNNLGFVGIQLLFIVPMGALFTAYGVVGFTDNSIWRWVAGILVTSAYLLLFYLLRKWHARNYEKMIGH
jgi:hypothetical protein